jgi:hypothetical protein
MAFNKRFAEQQQQLYASVKVFGKFIVDGPARGKRQAAAGFLATGGA